MAYYAALLLKEGAAYCVALCLSVRLSVRPVLAMHTYKNRSRVFVQPCGRAVSFVLFTFAGPHTVTAISRTSLFLLTMVWNNGATMRQEV